MELEYNNDGGDSTTTSEASVYRNIPLTVLDFFIKSDISNNGLTSFHSPCIHDCKSSSLLSKNLSTTDCSGGIN